MLRCFCPFTILIALIIVDVQKPELLAAPEPIPAREVPRAESFEIDDTIVTQQSPLPQDVVENAYKALQVEALPPSLMPPTLATARIPYALFDIESARPANLTQLKIATGFDVLRPDRAEYFWANVNGDGPSRNFGSVDFQDYRLYRETALGDASAFLEVPLRAVQFMGNETGGFSDLQTGLKSVLFQGDDLFRIPTANPADRFKISSVFRTYISPASVLAHRGLSTGHVSLEPGLLTVYEVSPYRFVHTELKYWIPIGGDSDHSGDVFRYGIGVSDVVTDGPIAELLPSTFALIRTLEMNGWEFLDGQETPSGGETAEAANGRSVVNLQPGLRLAMGGHVEFGTSYSVALTGIAIYRHAFRLELRWFK